MGHEWLRYGREAAIAVFALFIVGCGEKQVLLSPQIRVDKLDVAAACFRPCEKGNSLDTASFSEGLCVDVTPVACGFEAGVGQLRVIATANVDVDPKEALAAPKLTLLVDEKPINIAENQIVDRTTGKVPIFSSVIDVPTDAAADFALHFKLVDGYETEVAGLSILPPNLEMTVAGCDQECTRSANGGTVTVVMRHAPASMSGAKLLQWIDGEPLGPIEMTSSPEAPGFLEWRAAANIPAKVGPWTLQGTVGGHVAAIPAKVTVEAPTPVLEIVGCVDDTCQKAAGVGKLDVTLRVATALPDATLLQWIDDVPQTPLPLVKGPVIDGQQSFGFGLNAMTREGAKWRFRATVGAFSSNERVVTIVPPEISMSVLPCPANEQCSLSAGGEVVLVVTAPRDISPAKAIVKASLNGVPLPSVAIPVTLDEVMGEWRIGYFTTTVPTAVGKTWQLRASINESTSSPSAPIVVLP